MSRMLPLPSNQSALALERDEVIQKIDGEFNLTSWDHGRWEDLKNSMTFYPVRVRWYWCLYPETRQKNIVRGILRRRAFHGVVENTGVGCH